MTPTNPQCPKCWSYKTTWASIFFFSMWWCLVTLWFILIPLAILFRPIGFIIIIIGIVQAVGTNGQIYCKDCQSIFQKPKQV